MADVADPTSEDALLGGKLTLRQPLRGHRFGHDAVLLAAATPARKGEHAIELGAGVGAAGLALARRVEGLAVTLIELDPNLAAGDVQTMGDLESEASARRRFQTSLLSVFAGIALFLALVGLYGLMAYSVSRRTREVGIRMAFGAERGDVLLLVIKKAAFLLAIGLVSGLVASWFATRAIQAFLFGVKPTDPATFIVVVILFTAVALLACYIPARRATQIDPMNALRYE